MKLTTRSRYGTRMMLDLAKCYDEGPVRIGEIAKRQGISVKYLEQLIIPLKKANFIRSVRGPKGGHMKLLSGKSSKCSKADWIWRFVLKILMSASDLAVV